MINSCSFFPPPNLIITRNAHGAEEGEGLGSRLISIAHLVLTIPYVWRVTHEYINEGLKQGLKILEKFSCQSLGYKKSKDIIIFIIVNIYKMMFYPLIHRPDNTDA